MMIDGTCLAVVQELVREGHVPDNTSCVTINIKDGLDGAGNQIFIKEKLTKMVTMAFTVLDVVDTTNPVSTFMYDFLL